MAYRRERGHAAQRRAHRTCIKDRVKPKRSPVKRRHTDTLQTDNTRQYNTQAKILNNASWRFTQEVTMGTPRNAVLTVSSQQTPHRHTTDRQHTTNATHRPTHSTHCNTLQHTETHCNTLQHTASHYNTLQHAATAQKLMHDTALCSMFDVTYSSVARCYIATHCNTLQHAATLQLCSMCDVTYSSVARCKTATHCNTLQHTATVQHTATHCNTSEEASLLIQDFVYQYAHTYTLRRWQAAF